MGLHARKTRLQRDGRVVGQRFAQQVFDFIELQAVVVSVSRTNAEPAEFGGHHVFFGNDNAFDGAVNVVLTGGPICDLSTRVDVRQVGARVLVNRSRL